MNLSTMIDNSPPNHLRSTHPLPPPSSSIPNFHQLPPVSAHLSNSKPLQYRSHHHPTPSFPPLPTLTSAPVPKLPPLTSQLHLSDRIAPLSLPLPATKSIYSDSHGSPYDHTLHPTVSPVSVAHPSDMAYCVSPVSSSHPGDYTLPAGQSTFQPSSQPRPTIDDSLIARLRGFNEPASSIPTTAVPISKGEPQIRDTSESLAMGFVDNSSARPLGHLAAQPNAVPVSPDRPHACRKCSATFRRRDNLMAHIRAQHKGERPFKCEVCGFRFIKKDHAVKHWKVVHLKERPFVCTRCNSRFGQRSDLNKHVRSVHLRIKPFECEHCGLRFSHRGNQIRHQAVVHEKKKPFTCTECSSSFAEKSNLLKHCQAVHKSSVLFSG